MGNVDGVPIASQVKSAAQAARGDSAAAWETQSKFTERCIGAAQVRSLVEAARGDVDAAADTQRRFLANARRLLNESEVVDAVPLVAQLKSAAAAEGGDLPSALATQVNFLRRCPVVSQACSVYQAATGHRDEAIETQREFLDFAGRSLDKVPGLGHLKAAVHHSLGQQDRAEASLQQANCSASRGRRLLGDALQDMFRPDGVNNAMVGGGSSGSSRDGRDGAMDGPWWAHHFDRAGQPVEDCLAARGPLTTQEIRENSLCFELAPEQVNSHGACPICMQDFQPGEVARTLRCFHVFHRACADKWLHQNGHCPVCRVTAAPVSEPAA